jgi:hypothetical protein
MKASALAFMLALALPGVTLAAPPKATATCAATSGIKTEVELRSPKGTRSKIVNVTFLGKQPPVKEIDRILRKCVLAASQFDATQDILGAAWYRPPGSSEEDDELLNIYGPLSYLSFDARTKTIDVRAMNFGNKPT